MTDYAVLPEQRQSEILKILEANGSVTCAGLSSVLDVSEHTIRRDLKELARKGVCKRVHGGAVKVIHQIATFDDRVQTQSSEKRAISSIAANLVRPGALIFLDSGSTNVQIAEALPGDISLTIVTSSPLIAHEVSKKDKCEVILIGGALNKNVGGCTGTSSLSQISHIQFDQTFIGACAFNPTHGITAIDYEDAQFKREIIKQSNEVILPIIMNKTSATSRFTVASADDVTTIVISDLIPDDLVKEYELAGINVVIAKL